MALAGCSSDLARDTGENVLKVKNAPSQIASPPEGFSLPEEDNGWLVVLTTSAGSTGEGVGKVVISSDGKATATALATGLQRPCDAELTNEELKDVERAALSAAPERWADNYTDPKHPHGASDDLSTELRLYRRQANVSESYMTKWYESAAHMTLEDLAALHEAAMRVKGKVISNCRKR